MDTVITCGRIVASSALSAVNLAKSLASQQQMEEVGRVIAGPGSSTVFRDAAKVAQQYGGSALDWVKKATPLLLLLMEQNLKHTGLKISKLEPENFSKPNYPNDVVTRSN